MKRGVPNHEKTLHLQLLLGIPKPHAVGILQMLWFYAARFTPQGNLGIRTDEEIAIGCGWDHTDAPTLIKALTNARWLDEDPKHRLVVHDWAQECDRAVHAWLFRRGMCFICGTVPEETSLSKAERKRVKRRNNQLAIPGFESDDPDARFKAFYTAYPRKVNPHRAEKAYHRHVCASNHADILKALTNHIAYWKRTKRPKDAIPHPSTWLNAKAWQSELDTNPNAPLELAEDEGHGDYQLPDPNEPTQEQINAALGLQEHEQ